MAPPPVVPLRQALPHHRVAEDGTVLVCAAGTAALYLSSHPTATPADVEAQMKLNNGGLSNYSKDGSGDPMVYAGKY